MENVDRLARYRNRYKSALIQGERVLARSIIEEVLGRVAGCAQIYLEILAPAQMELGKLWHDGVINVAQEHLATTITIEVMDFLRGEMARNPGLGVSAVVTSLEGDQHYLGARMIADFLTMDGWDVDFLGSGTPAADIAEFAQERRTDLIALSATMPEFLPNARLVSKAIRTLSQVRPKIMLGGRALDIAAEHDGAYGCDAVARSIPEALAEARRLVGLTSGRMTLEDQLALLGHRIRETRVAKHMTQQDLANVAGLERTYISMVENGRQNLTIEAALKIANALEVQIGDLLSRP